MELIGYRFKIVNLYDVLAVGIAYNVELYIGDWRDNFSIEIVLLDEYDLILSSEFFDGANAMIDMKTKSIVITNQNAYRWHL